MTSAQDPLQVVRDNMAANRADLAIALLEELTARDPRDFAAWKLLGFAYHEEQRESEASNAFGKAAALNDRDAATAAAHAQSCYLAGFPAVQQFRHCLQLAPDDLNARRGMASALAAENQRDAAEAILCDSVRQHPDWLEGHRYLASLRYTTGEKSQFAASYDEACATQPGNLALRMAWFRSVAQTREWPSATRILDEGERQFGRKPPLVLARLFVASESGDIALASELFAETASVVDVVRDMALIRHSLRNGDLTTAEATASRYVDTPSAGVVWPYLSLIWRLRGDPRAQWLDGSPPFVANIDLDFGNPERGGDRELHQLADLLRKLHTARSPFVEQSVRGGTQTDQNLFLRHEPILQRLKSRVQLAVCDYVARLPASVPGHPLLGVSRDDTLRGRVFFSGSWSVRLAAQGFNVSHTHPMGWISSALYIALPPPPQLGSPPAGWIQFGTPPAELNLSLRPTLQMEPKVARLLLFPSRTWHSTVPFAEGERLVVSFDVRAPRAAVSANAKHRSIPPS